MITELLLGLDLLTLRYLNNKRLEQKEVNEYQLKLGFKNTLLYKRPLIIDMKTTPHLFVCGLSGSGKSRMIEKAIQGKQVILINVFEEDFKTIQARRINGNGNILKFLNTLLENLYKRDTPIFIVIDELLVLCMDKGITKAIADLLATGRHYNIFVIGISQQGTKESVKFKDLFNSRVCFRQVEESSYRSVLGYSPEDTQLKKRQFYLYSDVIERGYTYSIS
jgi:Cdc6-like AAA superfamily ATPase